MGASGNALGRQAFQELADFRLQAAAGRERGGSFVGCLRARGGRADADGAAGASLAADTPGAEDERGRRERWWNTREQGRHDPELQ